MLDFNNWLQESISFQEIYLNIKEKFFEGLKKVFRYSKLASGVTVATFAGYIGFHIPTFHISDMLVRMNQAANAFCTAIISGAFSYSLVYMAEEWAKRKAQEVRDQLIALKNPDDRAIKKIINEVIPVKDQNIEDLIKQVKGAEIKPYAQPEF